VDDDDASGDDGGGGGFARHFGYDALGVGADVAGCLVGGGAGGADALGERWLAMSSLVVSPNGQTSTASLLHPRIQILPPSPRPHPRRPPPKPPVP